MAKIKTLNEVLDQVANEAVRLYNDYPTLTIFEAIDTANTIMEKSNKGVVIVEDTDR